MWFLFFYTLTFTRIFKFNFCRREYYKNSHHFSCCPRKYVKKNEIFRGVYILICYINILVYIESICFRVKFVYSLGYDFAPDFRTPRTFIIQRK